MTEVAPPVLPPRAQRGPKVSIVMPTYRRASQIGDTIRSILAQTERDFELLVRDDGDGKDGTREAVEAAAAGDARVRYHRNPVGLRMPGNLNGGILETRGDYVAVCHDHDLYAPTFLAEMVAALERNPTATYAHTAIDVITQDGRRVATHVGAWPELTPGPAWLRTMLSSLHCPVCALTVVPRRVHEAHGLYDPSWGFISDVEMWMRLAAAGDVAYVSTPLIQVREREEGHDADVHAARLVRTAAAIQRTYLPRAHPAPRAAWERIRLEARLARTLAHMRLSRVRRALIPPRAAPARSAP